MGIEEDFQFEIKPLREEIDQLDDLLLFLLEIRFEICGDVAEVKARYGKDNHDSARERQIIERAISEHPNLSPDFIRQVYPIVLSYSRQRMEEVRRELTL